MSERKFRLIRKKKLCKCIVKGERIKDEEWCEGKE
jgi:hypothetical protein